MITIGKLAQEAGCTVGLIRHYEAEGLLPEPERSAGNQRRYSNQHRDRLLFVRHARELGFRLEEIRELMALAASPNDDCASVDTIAQGHLADIEQRISKLESMRDELKRMTESCAAGSVSECRIIEALSDHSDCHHAAGTADRH